MQIRIRAVIRPAKLADHGRRNRRRLAGGKEEGEERNKPIRGRNRNEIMKICKICKVHNHDTRTVCIACCEKLDSNSPSDAAACSAWVLVSARKPTPSDCDKWGDLWLWMPSYEKCGPQIGKLHDLHKATHWQPLRDDQKIPSPPNVQGMASARCGLNQLATLSPSPSPSCSHSSDSPMNHLPPVTEKGSPVGDETSEPEIHQPEMAVDLSGVPAGGTHHQNTIP